MNIKRKLNQIFKNTKGTKHLGTLCRPKDLHSALLFTRKARTFLANNNNYKDINYEILIKLLKSGSDVVLVDVRSPQEFAENRIGPAINIPLYEISRLASDSLPNKRAPIILFCQSGTRSKKACNILARMGYVHLYNLDGGLDAVL